MEIILIGDSISGHEQRKHLQAGPCAKDISVVQFFNGSMDLWLKMVY